MSLPQPWAFCNPSRSKLIRNLREQGLAVIVISHNLADIFEAVDRISILYLGRNNGVFNVHGTSQEQIVAAITGAEFGNNNQGTAQNKQRKGGWSR